MTYLVLLLISLLIGCTFRLSSQPKIPHSKGCGNILIPAAADFAGIGYFKMVKFANILDLQFLKKSVYYKHRGYFIYPEINKAWEKNQEEQFEEIRESGRTLSPGHNATYRTVTALDVKTNKVLDLTIVHVKVRSISLVLIQP